MKGLRIVIQGLGAVGSNLLEMLNQEGMEIFVHDIRSSAVEKAKAQFPKIKTLSQEEVLQPNVTFSLLVLWGLLSMKKALKHSTAQL